MTAYYNEIEPFAAQWLRNLIEAGHIAPGDVDERSIVDIRPSELAGYTQCHFFAGIGVWSYGLRLAGWPDDRPVWTGSCPCQPFSAAGKGGGLDDERHLWPAFHHLIAECRPPVVLGEQVASKDGLAWLDLVQADLEGTGYASAAVDLCAAGVGAPHIRQRLWWVGERLADAGSEGLAVGSIADDGPGTVRHEGQAAAQGVLSGGLADADGRHPGTEGLQRSWQQRQQPQDGGASGLADAAEPGRRPERPDLDTANGIEAVRAGQAQSGRRSSIDRPRPADGFWRDADWLFCRDGKWRPVSAKPQPLVDGSAESLGRVRPEIVRAIEEEVNAWSVESQIDSDQALRDLLAHFGTETQRCWEVGRVPGLHEAPFLLAFLRQLKAQGWRDAQRLPLSCEEIRETVMRSVRPDAGLAGPSRRYGLAEQLALEPADPLPVLSSLLARHARTAWGDAYDAYAETRHPLAHGAPARVGRLRAYGNAIVAQAAATFIGAYLDMMRAA